MDLHTEGPMRDFAPEGVLSRKGIKPYIECYEMHIRLLSIY